jgi:hypothetical protein
LGNPLSWLPEQQQERHLSWHLPIREGLQAVMDGIKVLLAMAARQPEPSSS